MTTNILGLRAGFEKGRSRAVSMIIAMFLFVCAAPCFADVVETGTHETAPHERQAQNPLPQPTPTPPQINTRPLTTQDSDMIDLGEPPLSDADMEKVMQWIGARTSALRLPFCWKLYENRPNNDLGVPMTCKAGYNQDTAGLCYKNCDERTRHRDILLQKLSSRLS